MPGFRGAGLWISCGKVRRGCGEAVGRVEAFAREPKSIGNPSISGILNKLVALANASPLSLTFYNLDLLLRQPVQLVHQRVDGAIGGVDLPLDQIAVMGGVDRRELLVQRQHFVHQRHHAIMPR
jgi:hypothetical protein